MNLPEGLEGGDGRVMEELLDDADDYDEKVKLVATNLEVTFESKRKNLERRLDSEDDSEDEVRPLEDDRCPTVLIQTWFFHHHEGAVDNDDQEHDVVKAWHIHEAVDESPYLIFGPEYTKTFPLEFYFAAPAFPVR